MSTDHPQNNTTVRYQYVRNTYLDGDDWPDFPVRDTWEEAAADAISAGRAEWVRDSELRLVSGTIVRVRT